jgi:hypothetical protein
LSTRRCGTARPLSQIPRPRPAAVPGSTRGGPSSYSMVCAPCSPAPGVRRRTCRSFGQSSANGSRPSTPTSRRCRCVRPGATTGSMPSAWWARRPGPRCGRASVTPPSPPRWRSVCSTPTERGRSPTPIGPGSSTATARW